jgi:hypothetical protein
VPTGKEIYDFPSTKAEKEEIVKFIHARLPCVPIKVIRANSLDPEAKVYRMRTADESKMLVGAVVFKDHESAEFREVKYFATAYQGGGFGSRLMNSLMQDAVIRRLFYIVLYASNTAVLFFEKQQFLRFPEQIIGLSRSVVLSRVEQYQRSTLMACDLLELFPSQFKSFVKKMAIGTEVLVSHGLRHTREEEGSVIEVKPPFKVKIRYPRWTSDTDEWIVTAARRIRTKPTASMVSNLEDTLLDCETGYRNPKKIRII